jgi:hypothetical protein
MLYKRVTQAPDARCKVIAFIKQAVDFFMTIRAPESKVSRRRYTAEFCAAMMAVDLGVLCASLKKQYTEYFSNMTVLQPAICAAFGDVEWLRRNVHSWKLLFNSPCPLLPSPLHAAVATNQLKTLEYQLGYIEKEWLQARYKNDLSRVKLEFTKHIRKALESAIRMHKDDAGHMLFDAVEGAMELRSSLPSGLGEWLYKDAIRYDSVSLIYRTLDLLRRPLQGTKRPFGPVDRYKLDNKKTGFLFRFGTTAMFTRLLSDGHLDPNGDRLGHTLLSEALRFRRRDIALLLLKHGADVNRVSASSGVTALYHATTGAFYQDVLLLLKHGADPNFPKDPSKSPLQKAEKFCFNKTLFLLRKGVRKSGQTSSVNWDTVLDTYKEAWHQLKGTA